MSVTLSRRAFLRQASLAAAPVLLGPAYSIMRELAREYQQLQITAIEPYVLDVGYTERCFALVRTSEGVTGIGETSPMNSPAAARLIRNEFEPLLQGMNPLDIEQCWKKVFYETYKQGVMGLQPEALAGVDIALWDILGKVTELPISQLMGGRQREAVRVYSSIGGGGDSTPQEMARAAEDAVQQGFTAVKIRMSYGPVPPDVDPAHDLDVLRAVRQAIGSDTELLYDVNNGYSVPTAIQVGKEIEELGVIHYEEPVAQTNYEGYAQVVEAVDVPVAAGEHEYTRWQFRNLIQQAHPDILQPDLVKSAGLSESIKVATLASVHHKKLVPHQTQPTIGQAANLHFVSVFVEGDSAQELLNVALKSRLHDLFEEPLTFENGRMVVPTGPGLSRPAKEHYRSEVM